MVDNFYINIPPIAYDTQWYYFYLPTPSMVFSLMSYLKSIYPFDPLSLYILYNLSHHIIDIITGIGSSSLSSTIIPQSKAYINLILKNHNLEP